MQKKRLLLVSLSHFWVDSYATMLTPVLPLVIKRLDLSLTYAGLLVSIFSLASLSQPLMGLWGDRMRQRHLILGGILLAAVFTPLLGIVSSYGMLILVLVLGGLGVHAFHPQAFTLAGELSKERRSFGVALFSFGGTSALGLTPLWMAYFVGNFGLERLPLIALPGLFTLFLVFKFVPLGNPYLYQQQRTSLLQSLSGQIKPLLIITLVVTLRSITSINFGVYLTVLGDERGLSMMDYNLLLTVYTATGVVGNLVTGYLADRMNSKTLVWSTVLLAAPALYGFLLTDGILAYMLLALGGCMILASNSILVAMAQELAPENAGLASSLPLGFSWGLAGLTLPLFGHLADQAGVIEALKYLSLLPLLTFLLALFLPPRKPHH